MPESSFTVMGTSRLGIEPRCHACGAGASLWFSWRHAHERRSQEDLRRISPFECWRALRRGKLYKCSVCDEVWHLDEDAERMTHVESKRLPLVLDWSREAIALPAAMSGLVQQIGPTPPDVYGNGSERRVTPCAVTTHSGERFDKAVICVQRHAPVEGGLRFRLGSEIAEITESPFALHRLVREASSRAHEVRMGFSPTLIEMPDGRRFVMNGTTHFFVAPGYAASDARAVAGSYFSEPLSPSFVETPNDVIYFVVDGDPGWVAELPEITKTNSSPKGWLRKLLGSYSIRRH